MTHPFDVFQRIYIINLPSRADRRKEMAEQLSQIEMSIDHPNVSLFKAFRPTDPGDFPTVGARGCFMSHLGVLKDVAEAGLERILILEDDVNFSSDFMVRASAVFSCASAKSWSILYGGHRVETTLASTEQCCEINSTTAVVTAHFIALQGPAIAAAAGYIGAMLEREPGHPSGGPMHVDGAYSWFRRAYPQYRTIAAVSALGYQRASRTDIHDLHWYDKTPGIRQVVAGLRRVSNKQ